MDGYRMMLSVLAGCCWVCSPLHSVSLSDALHGALNAWDSPEDLIPSVTDRQHILLLLSATRGIKKGFAALISLCFFFGTFSIGLEGGIVNALHRAHNNKETQLGRRENEGGGGTHTQSRELRILLVESHGHHRIDSL